VLASAVEAVAQVVQEHGVVTFKLLLHAMQLLLQ
jgi:hypothetical protein